MGARANYFLIRDGTLRAFYASTGAESMAAEMFWGEERAIPFVERLPEVKERSLLEGEAGGVIDIDHNVVLLFGGPVQPDIPLRRLYMKLALVGWFGWEVRWALAGRRDLIRYLALPPDVAAPVPVAPEAGAKPKKPVADDPLQLRKRRGPVNTVVSVCLRNGSLRFYPMSLPAITTPVPVPRLLEAANARSAPGRLFWSDLTDKFPTGGLHLDEGKQHGIWWAADTSRTICKSSGATGWNVEKVDDRFEAHVDETAGALHLPQRSQAELVAKLRGILQVGRPDILHGHEKRRFATVLEAAGVR
jgi:hypothetical protein